MNPGKELDVLVAEKVMGLYSIVRDFDLPASEREPTALPYSTDIGAAWGVVEKLGQERIPKRVISGEVQKYCLWLHQDIDGTFVAHFSPDENMKMSISAGFPTGSNTTAPHAICLAALKAVGYTVGEAAHA